MAVHGPAVVRALCAGLRRDVQSHLLVRDHGRGEIAPSLQLVAGRTAQAYNERKDRHGAFWKRSTTTPLP